MRRARLDPAAPTSSVSARTTSHSPSPSAPSISPLLSANHLSSSSPLSPSFQQTPPSPTMIPQYKFQASDPQHLTMGDRRDGDDRRNGQKHYISELTVDIPGSRRRTDTEPPPSRWGTLEFKFYIAAFIIVVPLLVWSPINVSSPHNPNYPSYANRLSSGWFIFSEVDDSDHQYHTFRSGFPSLVALAVAFLIPSHLFRKAGFTSAAARARFVVTFALIMLVALHGISALKVLAILGANFCAARARKPAAVERAWPLIVIVGNMLILFANEKFDGYHFSAIHSELGALDDLKGVYPRWHVSFNITMLRIVSFALDYHWRAQPQSTPPTDQRGRAAQAHPEADYSLVNYLAYTLYPPLYIAGPIMTCNDFVWQLQRPLDITNRERIKYLIRFAFCMLAMESIIHTMYVVAIKDARAWVGMTPAQLSMIGFWNLVIVWLKLLIPWRYFRLWALFDGVDAPENMVRCVANNYSVLGFWRSWHRSYNLWIVRYIYIPAGGAKRVVLSTFLVFTFVALWHDLSFRLLAWGWLVTLFIIPEITARALVPEKKYGDKWWYRHVAAIGGVVNILLLMGANLVGFVLGLDGMQHLLHELVTTPQGWGFMAFGTSCLFIGVQIMFEYRNDEARRGIDRRC
ncbi:uncharacterized protein CcaverHIS019_0501300 [Cutaneotrichosporon cavernicola]|uniref:MBOAT-domain-containing protein n=1 Tax=Cutaneotrichosporon cavernicola TaxID=279322 RepID=A0AA48L5T8_9TREE|nr:uncharacterized protein CcaverHIS019_0501300 [Cutaneotrichosporon cavernicola]BEI92502.1 hypothetical protein CcaverHIS019_0501300 [Cutaneotrichosporon cavernicola]